MAATTSEAAITNRAKLVFDGQQLLPAIPDDITLCHITSKLAQRDFHVLSSVSRRWCHAIRSREVHDARVCFNSAETFVVLNYGKIVGSERSIAIALYSMKDGSACDLPPIPGLDGGIPPYCRCVVLDGKIYILGGRVDSTHDLGSDKVFVLDLAGRRYWEQMASMRRGRQKFGCGVVDGKIYVHGNPFVEPSLEFEVYDPRENTWSLNLPLTSLRFDHGVAKLGEDLFDLDFYEQDCAFDHLFRIRGSLENLENHILLLESWEKMRILTRETKFMAQGNLHSFIYGDIYVHEGVKDPTRPFTPLRISLYAKLRLDPRLLMPLRILAVGDEILAAVFKFGIGHDSGTWLLQGPRFGNEDEFWGGRLVEFPNAEWFGFETSYFMYPIHL